MSYECSLDFLDKDTFELDIVSDIGEVLYSAGTEITPAILLELYFKEFSVVDPSLAVEESEQSKEDLIKSLESLQGFGDSQDEDDIDSEEEEEFLEFDEAHAQRIVDLSLRLAEKIGLSPDRLDDLKDAAYYHNIGVSTLTKKDASMNNFLHRKGEASREIILNEKGLSSEVAEVADCYWRKYDCANYPIVNTTLADAPFCHIVAIANYYDRLISRDGLSLTQALDIMLKIGGARFNIFILHKFIDLMRGSDE